MLGFCFGVVFFLLLFVCLCVCFALGFLLKAFAFGFWLFNVGHFGREKIVEGKRIAEKKVQDRDC
jgi:hypothetical protein